MRAGKQCDIRADTKLRNGYPNWWCHAHYAPARGEKGARLEQCAMAGVPALPEHEQTRIDMSDMRTQGAAIRLMGAPVYSTNKVNHTTGLFVSLPHDPARSGIYKQVSVAGPRGGMHEIMIDEAVAAAYNASVLFEKELKVIACPHCEHSHIDAGYFAVHYHKKHLCSFCNRSFHDKEEGIANPVYALQLLMGKPAMSTAATQALHMSKHEYQGISLWTYYPTLAGPAITDTAGIGVSLWGGDGHGPIQDIYKTVTIDGIVLDDMMLRYYGVQQGMAYLAKYMVTLTCPGCLKEHFDTGADALTPHKVHVCEHCGHTFSDGTRYKGVVSNPAVARLRRLK